MGVVDLPYPFPEDGVPPFSAEWVNAYRRSGWKALIPLPYGKQSPPPKGFTGRDAPVAKKEQLKTWLLEAGRSKDGRGRPRTPASNIAIVHSELTIAIDVDDYEIEGKRKNGGESLRSLEETLGPLPPTWRSSARGPDSPSGQRFYRIRPEHSPRLLDWDDKPGPHIEIVRWGHRYSVVWPSMNGRLGEVYRWYWDGGDSTGPGSWSLEPPDGTVPALEDLPYLPEKWVEYLTRGFTPYDDKLSERVVLEDEEAADWVASMPDATGAPCSRIQAALDEAVETMADGAHDKSRDALMHMMLLAWEGHRGLHTASMALRAAFLEEVGGRRSAGAARAEWYRNYKGAVDRLAARGEPLAAACACWEGVGGPGEGNGAGGDPAAYETNDDGNAEHLHALVLEDMLWCEGYKNWLIWNEENAVWTPDAHNIATARARLVGPRIKAAAGKLYDMADTMEEDSPEQKRARKKALRLEEWARTSGMAGRISGMLTLLKSREGVTVPMNWFDRREDLLTCKGQTIELLGRGSDEGVRVRESARSDYSLHSTGLEYVPWSEIRRGGAGSGLERGRRAWENYLDTFVPDTDLRWYLQKLLGYALYGANPERKIVFFQGPTSTGKSTILEAVSAALGAYAGPFNLSMFRENPNEAPRPDIVSALPRRVIVSTEGDGEWHLHADTIKRITGGTDTLKVRNLFSNEWMERHAAFVPFIGTNSSPTIQGADTALWQRVVVVPFEQQRLGKHQDNMAGIRLQSDLASRMALLSWLVDGYVGYAREGLHDAVPEAVRNVTKYFQKGVSEWHTFMNDAVEPAPGRRIWVQDLYDMYRIWGIRMDIPDKSLLNYLGFNKKIKANGYAIKRPKKPGTQNKADAIIDWQLRPAEEGAAGSGMRTETWSPQRYAEIQGSDSCSDPEE